ncbi:unnamed protein product [Lactuca saligna]|uniref:Uncharacterized protein n=1 Tax=Lactuca saligna TaxID=75948 RepID=A0AA35ZY46_LACSI|nr:unnamed protein product [Lactuca saligna]
MEGVIYKGVSKANGNENATEGSIVNYRWTGSHFTREVLENQKFNVRMLREEVKIKFGIEVSMGQCRRAKQYAMSLIKGTIVENYAKLWSYGEEIKSVKALKSKVKKRKAKGEDKTSALKKMKGKASALKKGKGQVQRGNGVKKGKGEGEGGSGIGFKTGQGECGSTSVVDKKNGKKEGTVKLRKKLEKIIQKKLAKTVEGKNSEGDTSTKPMDLD